MNKIIKFGSGLGLAGVSLVVFFVLSSPAKATTVEPHGPVTLQSGYSENTVISHSYPDASTSGLSNSIPPNAVVVEIGYGSDDHDYFVQATQGRFTQTSPGIWGVEPTTVKTSSAGVERRGEIVTLNYPPALNSYIAGWGWSASHTSGGQWGSDGTPPGICVHVKYRLFDPTTHALLAQEGEAGNCSQNGYSVPSGLRGFIRADDGSFLTGISHFQIGNDAQTRGGTMVIRSLATSSLGAKYNSDSIPTSSNVGVQQESWIKMRNEGSMAWTSNQVVPGSASLNCPHFYNYDPYTAPSNPAETCTDTQDMTSSNYLLKRVDTENSVHTQGEEFGYQIQVTTNHRWEKYCEEYSGGGTGFNGGGIFAKIGFYIQHLLFNTTLATGINGGGGTCITWVWSDAYTQTTTSIDFNSIANFPEVHYTGTAPGTFNLKFQMIDKSRNLQFGDVVIIPVTIAGTILPLGAQIHATSPIASGATTTVDWNSTNATSCIQYAENGYNSGNWVQFDSTLANPGVEKGPYTGPGFQRFMAHCINLASSPSQIDAVVTVTIDAPLPLDATMNAESPIANNSNTVLAWDSTNAEYPDGSCAQFFEDPFKSGNWVELTGRGYGTSSGNTSYGPLTTGTYRFMNRCQNSNASPTEVEAMAIVVVNEPSDQPLDATLDATSPVNVGQTTTLTWDSTNANNCQVYREQTYGAADWTEVAGANTTFGTAPYGPFVSAGNYRFLNYCQGSNTVPSSMISNIVTVVVNNVTPPGPPGPVSIDVSICEQATVSWTAASGTVTGYNIYRSTDGSTWQKIVPPSPVSNATFSYTDHPPLGNYYYAVTALNGAAESTKRTAGPANVHACSPDLSASDKDITTVSPVGINPKLTNVQPCNAISDPVVLNGSKSFKVGDIVTFRINVCNSGDETAQAVQVIDTLSNLSEPGNFSFEGCNQEDAQLLKTGGVNFTIGDVPPNTACSIIFTAKVTKPASGTIYRFQNIGDITPANWPVKRVVTPAYLFTDSTGNPDRNEIAP
jgi:uncharacterized repeat protein (TIGR01451 family)